MEILLRTEKMETQGNTARYTIGPLATGYGMTVGSALRHVLLSSLPGSAVTSIRIEGRDEDQRINHVLEDVPEIVLNVKQVRLRSFSDHRVSMHLEVRGQREVTAADIVVSPAVEIVNPEHHLATLTHQEAHLSMELVVENGKGYVLAASQDDMPEGFIPIDAIYMPVQRVNVLVEQARVGQMTNFEKIVLDITTDGTMMPDEALRQSADILVRHFTLFANYRTSGPEFETTLLSSVPIPWEIYGTPIEELDLSVRAYNSLKRRNITKVGQVLSMNDEDLLGIRNLGEKGFKQLRDRLLARNFLPDEIMIGDKDG